MPLWSERREDHEDLVAGVVGCEPEGVGPATNLTPSEPPVEVLQALAAPGCQMQLFEAKLVAGDLPELVDESGSDAATAEGGVGLEVVDGAPVLDESVGIAVEDDLSGKDAVGFGDEESALLRVETAEESVRDGRDVVLADRGERESRGAAGVGDRDPAADQLLPEFRSDVVRVDYLDKAEGGVIRHGAEDARGV